MNKFISLTELVDGRWNEVTHVFINAECISALEVIDIPGRKPHTKIALNSGKEIWVKEEVQEVAEKINEALYGKTDCWRGDGKNE